MDVIPLFTLLAAWAEPPTEVPVAPTMPTEVPEDVPATEPLDNPLVDPLLDLVPMELVVELEPVVVWPTPDPFRTAPMGAMGAAGLLYVAPEPVANAELYPIPPFFTAEEPHDAPEKGPHDRPLKGPHDTPVKGPEDLPEKGPHDLPVKGPHDVPEEPPPIKGPVEPPEQPAAEPPVVVVQPPAPFASLVPKVRARGVYTAFGLTVLAGLFAAIAAGLRRLNNRLGATGALPAVIRTVEVLMRLAIVFFGLGALGSVVPASIAPVLPIVVMAAAVAVGWSARDVAQDLVAGVFIAVEGQLRAGYWVSGERYSGSVEALGLRVTWLRDVHGRRIVVPNRVLLAQPLVTDDKPWPRIQFKVRLAVDAPIRNVRKALEEAVLLSPWVAPEPEMEVHPDAMDETVWHVAVRVLDSRYAHRFQGLLRERVMEILTS